MAAEKNSNIAAEKTLNSKKFRTVCGIKYFYKIKNSVDRRSLSGYLQLNFTVKGEKILIQKDELKRDIKALIAQLNGIGESLDLDALKKELSRLNEQMHADGFWNDVQKAQGVAQRAKNIEYKIGRASCRERV